MKRHLRWLVCAFRQHPYDIVTTYGRRDWPQAFIPRKEECSNCGEVRRGFVGEPLLFRSNR